MNPRSRHTAFRPPAVRWHALVASLALAVVGSGGSAHAVSLPDRVDFNFHIRPLLSDRCFACHGPDDKARKAKLDLHTRARALRGGSSGDPALRPGDAPGSELLKRLLTSDPEEVMPPPESKLPPLHIAKSAKATHSISPPKS